MMSKVSNEKRMDQYEQNCATLSETVGDFLRLVITVDQN